MVKTAVIMAAGMGTRFGSMTEDIPKGFIPAGNRPMVLRSIETLKACGIKRIIIGTGYHKEKYESLAQEIPCVECVFSPRFAETNSMYTLYHCRTSCMQRTRRDADYASHQIPRPILCGI